MEDLNIIRLKNKIVKHALKNWAHLILGIDTFEFSFDLFRVGNCIYLICDGDFNKELRDYVSKQIELQLPKGVSLAG